MFQLVATEDANSITKKNHGKNSWQNWYRCITRENPNQKIDECNEESNENETAEILCMIVWDKWTLPIMISLSVNDFQTIYLVD